ncbi:ATP-dependent RNA helicase DHX36 [Grifola frondosa]|uniref:ATP-dependent RNA helicase DHX36 n=1 Tax=Grifola frondosa TaxID=5627 RepID=A0A1C7MQ40_GRIFR|nr:ATP-dependent RNA helicase DHX36 [Grifola frondosa]
MQLDPSKTSSPLASPSASSSHPTLSRQYAKQAHALKEPSPKRTSSSPAAQERPGKVPKIAGAYSAPQAASSSMSRSNRPSHLGSAPSSLLSRMHDHPGGSSSRGGKRRQTKGSAGIKTVVHPGPVRDDVYIERTHMKQPLKPSAVKDPKSSLSNFLHPLKMNAKYEAVYGTTEDGQSFWRSSVNLVHADFQVVGSGDHSIRKSAEALAALSALYQLDALGVLQSSRQFETVPTHVTLSDGSQVDTELSRHFMDYYCRRFNFGKPEITFTENAKGGTSWQADMTVGGRRIGFGKGNTKKQSESSCYLDVIQYLEKCDPDIWKTYLQDVKEGKDLGLAPKVLLQVDDNLDDKIANLCDDITRSTLYRNRPISTSKGDGSEAQPQEGSSYNYRPPPQHILTEKSEQLRRRREAYLTNPELESIRNTRASLPVFSKCAELMKHIQEHDVTICMAATGSGKTTQIPQLILDEFVDRGEGAKCNIVCTQPRRIAAISVAQRVASERGEHVGRGSSIGYQVRFEAKLPDYHGSVTYCTTGAGRTMDDVTHIVVDEVHERDVDIDLMLVVLKRLLKDRKAQGRPIKVILMSATIDPTLFKNYFPDEQGKPAGIVEIPGRAFPVTKRFLDDFVPPLVRDLETAWVFREPSVQKYLAQEIGLETLGISYSPMSRPSTPSVREGSRDTDDLELPIPLVALTIAHVLKRSDDGHVLVFLPGWDDISSVQKCLLDRTRSLGLNFTDTSKYAIHLLHSSIPVEEQQAIFRPPPEGIRRIILATNIAETSVTIPDVVYVVDTARVKEQRFDPSRHISALVSAWVGTSNLNQRAGRAGRHRPGEYFGILSRNHSEELHPHQTVEMKRVDLDNVVMHVKALNFPGMTVQEVLAATIEPPAADRIEAAIKSLQMVGALDAQNQLTSLGRVLLQLPVDVRMGRLVLAHEQPRAIRFPIHIKNEANAKKNSWSPEEFRSDVLAALRAYNEWWDLQRQGFYVQANRFCMDNFLSKPTLLMVDKVKTHLLRALYDVGIIDISGGGRVPYQAPGVRSKDVPSIPPMLNSNGDSLPILAALIAIASQPKYAIRTGERTYRTAVDKIVLIHPSSVNHRKRDYIVDDAEGGPRPEKQIIAYTEKRQNISTGAANAQKFLVSTTRLDPLTYLIFGAYRVELTSRGLECDGWLPIVGRTRSLNFVGRLKIMMENCMLRVFEGVIANKEQPSVRDRRSTSILRDESHEGESGDEDDGKALPLTTTEIKEFDLMTQDVVRVLNYYSQYRMSTQSAHNSRPGTPFDSPTSAYTRLHPAGSRSGYSTPYGLGSSYDSRPSTPSGLSRRFYNNP